MCAVLLSPQVRWSVANKFEAICGAFGPEIACTYLLTLGGLPSVYMRLTCLLAFFHRAASSLCASFEKLLQDPEAEVRTAAAGHVAAVAAVLPREQVRNLTYTPAVGYYLSKLSIVSRGNRS